MILFPTTGFKDSVEPFSVSSWIYLETNPHWIHICDNCIDMQLLLPTFNIPQHPNCFPYAKAKVRQCVLYSDELVLLWWSHLIVCLT
jgi:hypothetical protein